MRWGEASIVRETVLRHIAGQIRTTPARGPAGGPWRDGRPTTVGLIGPTGVAPAAAPQEEQRHAGLRVGLITCDTYRIAAVEQLRTYAGILAIPLRAGLPRRTCPARAGSSTPVTSCRAHRHRRTIAERSGSPPRTCGEPFPLLDRTKPT